MASVGTNIPTSTHPVLSDNGVAAVMFGYSVIETDKLDYLKRLANSLETFVFVAETDGSKSKAVAFVRGEIEEYKRLYGDIR